MSLDPSWDAELIRDPLFFERAAGADVFLPNMEGAEALTGQAGPEAALVVLRRHFPIVALKRGSEGAILACGSETIALQSPRVAVVDTTGAGDAFDAGFIHAWLNGVDTSSALAAAIDAGTRSVQASGGTGSIRRAV